MSSFGTLEEIVAKTIVLGMLLFLHVIKLPTYGKYGNKRLAGLKKASNISK